MTPRYEPSPGLFLYLLGLVIIASRPGRFWLGVGLAVAPMLIGAVGTLIGGERWRRL